MAAACSDWALVNGRCLMRVGIPAARLRLSDLLDVVHTMIVESSDDPAGTHELLSMPAEDREKRRREQRVAAIIAAGGEITWG
jgi:hypothetical protein